MSCISFALLLGDDEDVAEEAPEEPIVEEVAVVEEVEETEVEEVEEVEIPEVEVVEEKPEVVESIEEETEISDEDRENLLLLLALAMMEENFAGIAEIDYVSEENLITIFPIDEGFADAIMYIETGLLSKDEWYTLRDNYVGMSLSISENIGEGIVISLLNPANADNTILTVVDGVILYDVFE